tara:strand:+ start:308 stop:1375 length:1068 start_codon:yes stop_codon:yes gene_type:complete
LKTLGQFALAGVIAGTVAFAAGGASAECTADNWQDCKGKPWTVGNTMDTPLGEKWWPSMWGADDEAGSTNWFTKPEVVLRAIAEADKGKVYKLGQPYEPDMPLFGARKFSLRIPGTPTGGPFGANKVIWHDEFLATEVGQVGTQFDGLGHIGVMAGAHGDKSKMYYYNGFTEDEVGSAYGLQKVGTEKLHPIVARGILIDVAAAKGVDMLEKGYEITMADVKEALEKQGMADFQFMEGDAVLFRTGWMNLWKVDNAKFNSGEPGIGMEVAKWLSNDVKAGAWGGDTWATEVVPNPDPGCAFCVHQHMLARHGIVNQENMNLNELSSDGVYRFTYMYTPTPIVGATGSMGSPIAID